MTLTKVDKNWHFFIGYGTVIVNFFSFALQFLPILSITRPRIFKIDKIGFRKNGLAANKVILYLNGRFVWNLFLRAVDFWRL